MRRTTPLAAAAALALLCPAAPALAGGAGDGSGHGAGEGSGPAFERVATYDVAGGVAEIIAATADGRTLVHTDSSGEQLGVVDLSDPAHPRTAGEVPVGGEPTSVAVVAGLALVVVDGPDDLAVVDLATREVVARVPLGGQPDSVAVSPDGDWAAVAVEDERDEDVDGGALPQDPPGHLSVVSLAGDPGTWAATRVALTGLPGERFPTDPEPEFVDIDDDDVAAVTIQENNAVALVDLRAQRVTASWSTGTATHPADLTDDGDTAFDEELTDARREPDGISWTPDGNLLTANEGDYDVDLGPGQHTGGRGFTVFSPDGRVLFDPGADYEVQAALRGHYDDSRSDDRGVEAEGTAVGTYDGVPLAFVGSERGDFVGVYRLDDEEHPRFLQLLPTGDAPEGLLALPQRGLFLASGEDDGTITVYSTGAAGADVDPAASADLLAPDVERAATALSGLAAAPGGDLYAVPDDAVSPSRIYTLDPSGDPASVTASLRLSKGGEPASYDLEGVAARTGGGWWVVSEGAVDDPGTPDADESAPDLLVAVDAGGAVVEEVALPGAATAGRTGRGFEGVAESSDGQYVYVAVQDAWDGDETAGPDGQRTTKIARYEVSRSQWTFARYPLDAPPDGAAVGLSEITPAGGSVFAVIERDDLADDDAVVKRVYAVDLSGVQFAPAGGDLPVLTKVLARDLVAEGGYRPEEAEGLARATDGTWYLVNDNDGGGETELRRYSALSGRAAPPVQGALAGLDPQLVGTAVLAKGPQAGAPFGGLSGLTYDADRDVYYAISDDRSELAPARFSTLRIDLSDGAFDPGDVDVVAVTTLTDASGQPFAPGTIDAEGIALTPEGTLLVTSEGEAAAVPPLPPFVREFGLDGAQLADLPVPGQLLPTADGTSGVRDNLALEPAALAPSGDVFWTGSEEALAQDGPTSTLQEGSTVRLVRYDTSGGVAAAAPDRQVALALRPVPQAPVPAGASATTGLSDLLALDDDTLLALQRSYSAGVGNSVTLSAVCTRCAADVSGLASLSGQDVRTARSQLLLDLGTLGIRLDNVEGLALGPRLPDGRRSLLLVSDDNFSDSQVTQVIVLALDESALPTS